MPGIKLLLGGDAMLGRLVGKAIERYGPAYPLAPVASLMRSADLTIANLECAITACRQPWQGPPKAFYFGAPPAAIDTLTHAGVGLVSLANNHIFDFGAAGLADTLQLLDAAGIAHAGAGADLAAATRPAHAIRRGLVFGMAAFCDHQADFAAGKHRPGMAYLDLDDEAAATAQLRAALQGLLAQGVEWPILSLHWGPNFTWRPSARFRRLAAAAAAMGWKLVYGHSAHVFHGIEIIAGTPVLYAAGDLVDDYRIDPTFRNDRQLLFELTVSRGGVEQIMLHPITIARGQAGPAGAGEHAAIIGHMARLCAELGTHLDRHGECAPLGRP